MSKYINTQLLNSENVIFDKSTQQKIDWCLEGSNAYFKIAPFTPPADNSYWRPNFMFRGPITFKEAIETIPEIAANFSIFTNPQTLEQTISWDTGTRDGYLCYDSALVNPVRPSDEIRNDYMYYEWGQVF